MKYKVGDKVLLLKDLCARLPYGVKVESVFINPDTKEHKPCGIEIFDATSLLMIRDGLGEFKPYLFPLSSMTEEQKKELNNIGWYFDNDTISNSETYYSEDTDYITHTNCYSLIDWLIRNHFDFRCLIEKGLALDATGLNIY